MKGFASNKAKILWWRLIFLTMGEPHNHKPILPDTAVPLLITPQACGDHSHCGLGQLFLCAPPHIKGSECRGGRGWKGNPGHAASACSVSSGASGVICPAALCLVFLVTVVQGWSTVGCCCAAVSGKICISVG